MAVGNWETADLQQTPVAEPLRAIRGPRLIGQGLLLVLLVLSPWWFGSVQPAVQVGLAVGLAIALGCAWLDEVRQGRSQLALPVVLLPVALALLLGAWQLVPLPGHWHRALAPKSHSLWSSLDARSTAFEPVFATPVNSTADEFSLAAHLGVAQPQQAPISLYPAATRNDLSLLVLALAGLLLGSVLFSTPRSAYILWLVVAANGCALAFFGLVQQMTWDGKLFWNVPLTHGGMPFASFVSRNSGGGYLNLCLAAGVGLIVLALSRPRLSQGLSPVRHAYAISRTSAGVRRQITVVTNRLLASIARLDFRTLLAFVLAGFIATGVICSQSRGAWVSLAAAMAIVAGAALVVHRRRALAVALAVPLILAAGLVAWVGMEQAVQERGQTLLDPERAAAGRMTHWQDSLQAANHFWLFGSGIGTYRHVYPLFEYGRLNSNRLFYHAESQYIEALVVGGILGLSLMVTAIVLVGLAGMRLLKSKNTPAFACGMVGLFALTTQVVHASVDFSLYLPATFLLLAVLAGSTTAYAAKLRGTHSTDHSTEDVPLERPDRSVRTNVCGLKSKLLTLCGLKSTRRTEDGAADMFSDGTKRDWLLLSGNRFVGSGILAVVLVITVWSAMELRAVSHRAGAKESARRVLDDPESSERELQRALTWLDGAPRGRDDFELQRYMADVYLELYRRPLREKLLAENPRMRPTELDRALDLSGLHGQVYWLHQSNRMVDLDELQQRPGVLGPLRWAARHLALARQASAVSGSADLELAKLAPAIIGPEGDTPLLARAERLAAANPEQLLQCGTLHLQAGRVDRAASTWQKTLALAPQHVAYVLDALQQSPESARYIPDALPQSPELILDVVEQHLTEETHHEVRSALLDRASRLADAADPPDQRYRLLGLVAAATDDFDEAISNLTQAVQMRPDNADWRYELARVLSQSGSVERAHEQARLCVHMDPGNPRYLELLRSLIRQQLTSRGQESDH